MKIRIANDSEYSKIADIHIESWKDSYSNIFPADDLINKVIPSLQSHWLNVKVQGDDVVLVAENNGIIGFIAVWCRPEPFIDNLHVKPLCRSQSVGSALLKSAAVELINRGKKTGYLWVFNDNINAIRFYNRLGGFNKECAEKDIFGYKVLSTKVVWDDLTIIANIK